MKEQSKTIIGKKKRKLALRVSQKAICKKRVLNKISELNCKKIFEEIDILNVNRKKKIGKILRTLAKDMKATKL